MADASGLVNTILNAVQVLGSESRARQQAPIALEILKMQKEGADIAQKIAKYQLGQEEKLQGYLSERPWAEALPREVQAKLPFIELAKPEWFPVSRPPVGQSPGGAALSPLPGVGEVQFPVQRGAPGGSEFASLAMGLLTGQTPKEVALGKLLGAAADRVANGGGGTLAPPPSAPPEGMSPAPVAPASFPEQAAGQTVLSQLGLPPELAGLVDATAGTNFLRSERDLTQPTSTLRGVAAPTGPVTRETFPGGRVVDTPENVKPETVIDTVVLGGRPWKRVRYVNPYTGQEVAPPQHVDPDDWNSAAPPGDLQALKDAGVPVRPGMTRGEAFLVTHGAASGPPAPATGGPGPGLSFGGSGGMPTSAEKAAQEAAARASATLRVEQTQKPLGADELAKYMDPAGGDLEGSWTQADLTAGLNAGTVAPRPKPSGGEVVKNLAVLVPKALQDLDEMQAILFPRGKFDPGILKQAEFVPEMSGKESAWNPKKWIDVVQRMTNAAPVARRFVELQGSTQELVGRLLSGGVINPEEAARFVRSYIPRAGVDGSGAAKKIQQLKQIYMSLQKIGAPESMTLAQKSELRRMMGLGAPPPMGGGVKGPKVGTVDGGYRFKGGNPADKKNWEKVK